LAVLPFALFTGNVYYLVFLILHQNIMNSIFLLFQESGGSGLFTFLPLVVIPIIFYFLLIRPQKQQQQKTAEMQTSLKNGDEVVTNGGVIGKIKETRETSFIIMSAEKSLLEVAKSAVVGRKSEV
jgi:preprotein translocase subunit YajC